MLERTGIAAGSPIPIELMKSLSNHVTSVAFLTLQCLDLLRSVMPIVHAAEDSFVKREWSAIRGLR